jgi:dihydropteroate synthase
VDTVRAKVAAAALGAGARLVNDVSGGLADPEILSVVAERSATYILQHWQTPFDHRSAHVDVVREVVAELGERVERALAAGVNGERLILDPGIGFGKTAAQNWALIANQQALAALGYRLLWGFSRKRFLAEVDGGVEPWERDDASAALTALVAREGAWAVRVHTIGVHKTAIRVAHAVRANQG